MHDLDSTQEYGQRLSGAKVKTIGIIGLGSIGMRHASNLLSMGHKVYGWDPHPGQVANLQHKGGSEFPGLVPPVVYGDYNGFIIASPTRFHMEHLSTFTRNVFVEKPITHGPTLGLNPSNILMVGYNLRFHGCVKKAKEWLQDIGDPQWANFILGQFSEKPPYLRDGVILNWSHEIDLALYLLGDAIVESSRTRLTDGKDDLTDINLKHASGCRSSVHLDYITAPEIRQFIIVGNRATIIADLANRHAWLRDRDGSILEHFEDSETWNDNYIEEMQAFLDRIDGNETLGCTAKEALKVLDICLEVRKQARLT